MKPIIILAVVAIAAIGIGVGSLNNVINLTVQQFGVGATDIVTPVSSADVKFDIQAIQGNAGYFKNYIQNCYVSSPEDIDAGSKIWCKLTNEFHQIIAEGHVGPLVHTLKADTPITILINDPDNSLVQNVHDVTVVVQGPKVTQP